MNDLAEEDNELFLCFLSSNQVFACVVGSGQVPSDEVCGRILLVAGELLGQSQLLTLKIVKFLKK